MRGGRLGGISHPEIDYVLTRPPRLLAKIAHHIEDIRRKPFDSGKIHLSSVDATL
jgi:hypothetical protein